MDVLRFECEAYTITIQTANNTNAWKRFQSRVNSVENPDAAWHYCDYRSSRKGVLSLDDFSHAEPTNIEPGKDGQRWEKARPVVFETNSYNIFVEFHNIKGTPRIIHARKEISEGFTYYPQLQLKGGILSGHIDFLNEPGTFSLRFEYATETGNRQEDWLHFDVVSPKLDTKHDLQRIKDVIFEEYDYQIFQYLTTTFTSLHLDRTKQVPNNVVWLAIFKSIFKPYVKSVNYIIHAPNRKALREEQLLRPDKIKRWNPQQENIYGEACCNLGKERANRNYYRTVKTINTTDTVENRFVKFTLLYLVKRMRIVFHDIQTKYSKYISPDEVSEMNEYERQIKNLSQNPFFRSVGTFEGFRQHSAVLQQRSGYSQVYRFWLMLHSSIDMAVGTTNIGLMPIWKLYEIWCFLTMKKMIQQIMSIKDNERHLYMDEYPKRAMDMFINPDANVSVTFRHPNLSTEARLCYQETYTNDVREGEDGLIYPHTETTQQRPDIVLYIRPSKSESKFRLTYLYDAKYRVKDAANTNDSDSPLEDTLNQMHRYRDAIYFDIDEAERPRGKEIIGGFILFPGRGEKAEVEKQAYYKSIEKVNIGAFPLLPKRGDENDYDVECSLLEEHLRKVILGELPYEQIKDSIPQKGLRYEDASDGNDIVLVSKIRGSGVQRKWIADHLLLNIPIENITKVPDLVRAQQVIVFDNEGFAAFSVIPQKAECWTKKELSEKGYPDARHDNYFMLKLEKDVTNELPNLSLAELQAMKLDKETKLTIVKKREIC